MKKLLVKFPVTVTIDFPFMFSTQIHPYCIQTLCCIVPLLKRVQVYYGFVFCFCPLNCAFL